MVGNYGHKQCSGFSEKAIKSSETLERPPRSACFIVYGWLDMSATQDSLYYLQHNSGIWFGVGASFHA